MSNKQDLIKQMLEMQHKFSEYEHQSGVDPEDFYLPPEGHPLYQYRQKYNELALKVLEMAHAERGSHR